MKQIIATVIAAMVILASTSVFAQTGNTEGEVRRVDKSTGKVTLRHGPITGALEMPAMSMVFQTKDPALLDRLKPGDRGRFVIRKDEGGYWILSAEPEK
ncbi:copper-binding protein [Ferrovibrio sp.]|uniref:copper-binding protein n=1 Tax=Ferrovibrio sp. TaxID=1917215 RepID=UPI002638E7B6|nr:copper-binding protein [Ferrovibrio sp.]